MTVRMTKPVVSFPVHIADLPHPRVDDLAETIAYGQALGYAWAFEDAAIDFRIPFTEVRGVGSAEYARFHLWVRQTSKDKSANLQRTYRWFRTMGRTDR